MDVEKLFVGDPDSGYKQHIPITVSMSLSINRPSHM